MTAPSRRKARLRALALTGLAGTAWAAAPPVAANTVAILPLRGGFNVPRAAPNAQPDPAGAAVRLQLEDQLNQRVALAFFRLGRFQFIQGTQVAAGPRDARFEQGGPVDDGTAARLGRQLGAAQVLVGAYAGGLGHTTELKTGFFGSRSRTDSYPGHLEVRLRLVSTEDGSVRETILVHATSLDPGCFHSYELLLEDFNHSLNQELAVRFPPTGTMPPRPGPPGAR